MNSKFEKSVLPQAGFVKVEAAIEMAWDALRQGTPSKALQISQQLLAQKKANFTQVPWAQSTLVLALNEHLIGNSARAAERLYGVMSSLPKSEIAMQLYMSMLREHLRKVSPSIQPGVLGRIVLGLGTGRSGSTSLSYLFAAQSNTCFSHEHAPLIPWYHGEPQLEFHMARMALLARLYGCVADVSHWWLPKLETIIRQFPQVRAVVTRRDKQETVKSFLRIKGVTPGRKPINHWKWHDGEVYQRNLWDQCYPKFDAESLEQAVGMYWEDYYEKAQWFASHYPDQVRIYDIEQLSTPSGQMEILQFCGFQNGLIVNDLMMNKGSTKDGSSFWKNPFTAV